MSESNPLPSARDEDRLRELLDEIGERERQIARLQAEQALAVAAFTDARRSFDFSHFGLWDMASRRLVAMELADARRVSTATAEHHMWDSLRLVEECPLIMEKFLAGDVSLQAARAVVAETVTLQPESRPLADEILSQELPDVLARQARLVARTRVLEIDPDAAVEQAWKARAQRFVSVSPGVAIGTGNLTSVLPVEQAAACWYALDERARALHADGDDRSVPAIMADTLVERVTGQRRAADVVAHVSLVMTDATLLGLSDQPGQLRKGGPVPASIAGLLAADENS